MPFRADPPFSELCHDRFSYTGGKLLLQSNLVMASTSLSFFLHDLDLLLKAGVLRQFNAIVLSQLGSGSGNEELGFLIHDIFACLQIGGSTSSPSREFGGEVALPLDG
ncbi:hypothetical protein NE237_000514 [Protea cynaroides]|uniref:DUF7032 domain-containing protein n=1 Tax=Protea cynaroides TaxID=273540 RepID=A0A9Q0KRB4_9MAGN|nr:hypothetical protein NE237_000514 [Protea cynaroides]